jgi:sec-independent protein translocase protein TatA
MPIGIPELLIVLVIVLILFGPGRFGKVLGELGSGLRAFRDSLKDKGEEKDEIPPTKKATSNPNNPDRTR